MSSGLCPEVNAWLTGGAERGIGDWWGLPEAIGTPEHVEPEERIMPNGYQSRPGPVPMQNGIKKALSGIVKAQKDYKA